jgi:hypothetical protein
MASKPQNHFERQMHMLFSAGVTGPLTDTELLERFITRDGEAAELAFAGLVARHGPVVLGVCRQTLRDTTGCQPYEIRGLRAFSDSF